MTVKILHGDCREVLKTLPDQSVNCCVTSPPYFNLRDYGIAGQIGLEKTPEQYVDQMVAVFSEVKRVLRDDGTLFINLGDSYNGSGATGGNGKQHTNGGSLTRIDARAGYGGALKQKDLIGIPWMVAFALRADGWYLRSDIIWAKTNCMPESVTDRPTRSHEYIFLLSKSPRYYYDHNAIKEPAIYDVDGTGTAARKARTQVDHKGMPTAERNGMRPAGFKDATAMNGKHRTDKQRGHSRRHAGFNDRWDAMTKEEQCVGMRNKRDVWTVPTAMYADAHFATFNPKLIEPCVLAGCPQGGVVLDPFGGAGTTGLVADRHHRDAILIELNPAYADLAQQRLQGESPLFAEVTRPSAAPQAASTETGVPT